jgi:hypothetical protein
MKTILALLLPIILTIVVVSCSRRIVLKNIVTPKEYLITAKVDKAYYVKDKEAVLKQIEYFFYTHKESFYNQRFIDSTFLMVDTIFYSENLDKIGTFIIEKIPASRMIPPQTENQWVYNAYCYLGKRQTDTFDLRWLQKFSFIGNRNIEEGRNYLKSFYLLRFTTPKYPNPTPYEYNMDDKRFWNSKDWRLCFKE